MTTVTFTDQLAVNPGLEDVLDPTGTVTTATSDTFAITHTSGGPWDGFVFTFHGGGFTYERGMPTGGGFSSADIMDGSGHLIATITGFNNDTSLANFYNRLTTS